METHGLKPLLAGKELVLGYGRRSSITPNPLSFLIPEGKLTFVIGKNGSGKSTLFRALLGEAVIHQGNMYFDGNKKARTEQFAYVSQDPIFQPFLRVKDFLELSWLKHLGMFKQPGDKETKALENVVVGFCLQKLLAKPMGSLSSGERQRVLLARAILQNPSVLILDEPTNHLDPDVSQMLWELLADVHSGYCKNILIASHDLLAARAHATWLIALRDGTIRFCGEPSEFWNSNAIEAVFDRRVMGMR